jgi:diguanylate cyclase (GGDEF)-like protein/PAS domain S-box-containing protein
MRIRTQLLSFIAAALALAVFAAALVAAAARREDDASDALQRAQTTEHEVAGLLALTQEYARYAEPRAAEQWHLRHAAIAAALEDGARRPMANGVALAQLRAVVRELPPLFARLEEIPADGDSFTARRKEALLDQLLTNTQAMSDYAYQWFQDSATARSAAQREFGLAAFVAPCAMLLMLVAAAIAVRRRVLQPMKELERAATAIRRGDLSFRLESAAQDEFGDLSRGFDAMTAALLENMRLRERSEQQLRAITDNLPALVAYIDLEHRYRFANDRYREWLGKDPRAMIGQHVATVRGEATYEAMGLHLDAAMRGERVQWEHAVRHGGTERHLLSEVIPDAGADGRVRGCYALTVDITERRAAQLRIERSEQRLADLINAIPAMVGYFDMEERCQYANDAGLKSQGLQRGEATGMPLRAALGELNYAQHEPYVREALQGRRARLEGRVPFQGREAHFQAHLIPDRVEGGAQRGFYIMTFDITALKEAQTRQADSERRLRAIADNLPVSISYVDSEERFRFVNRTGLEWAGRPSADVLGRRVAECVPADRYALRRAAIAQALAGERVTLDIDTGVDAGTNVRSLQCVYVPDIQADGSVAGIYGLETDVSALKNVERQLSLLVRSDALTGLANRYQFNEQMPQILARARRARAGVALMYLDVDRFKQVNDTLGHAAGDAVLQAFAQRLAQSVRTTDTVARLGGDEFVVVLEGVHGEAEPQFVARKIIASVARPLVIDGRALDLTTSIGIAYQATVGACTLDEECAQALLARADEALYQAKAAGRNTFRVLSAAAQVTAGGAQR